MRGTGRGAAALSMLLLAAGAGAARAELTANEAVRIALQKNPDVVRAEAGVLDARAQVQGAYSGVLPQVSAQVTRSGSTSDNVTGPQFFQGLNFPSSVEDPRRRGTTPQVQGSWDVFDLSALNGLRAAQTGLKSSQWSRTATRQAAAFGVRRQFYETVKAYHLAGVSDGALRVARENERRVSALFQVGSVSRSDLLKAQVQTSQGELDSIRSHYNITTQRIQLANLMGVSEAEVGPVDTSLVVDLRAFSDEELVAEARANRPDLKAAEASMKAAEGSLSSARLAYLPTVTLSGVLQVQPRGNSYGTRYGVDFNTLELEDQVYDTWSRTRQVSQGQVALVWNLFDGFGRESRVTSAQANVVRQRDYRDQLSRQLEADMRSAIQAYRESAAGVAVAQRSFESGLETLKLVQQKYNVGSATILELNDALQQLQRNASELVSAKANMRVAEARIEQLRGRGDE